ncbi:MAG TPA: transcription termination factor Rho [Acidimicrobiales bacterium]|nr:transcription termination factor Rho [Acidimicrobiales bacterium]
MSGFERALLEGKERDELSKIAESLGKKPPARAKKAAMIDLILELAGVSPAGGGEATAPDATEPAAASRPDDGDDEDDDAAPGPADRGSGEDDPAPVAGGGDDGSTRPGSGSDGGGPARAQPRGGASPAGGAPQGGSGSGGGPNGQSSGGDQDRPGQGAQNQGGQGQGGQNQNQGSQGQNQGGQNQSQGGQDPNQRPAGATADEEADGNRRRRRRGRNRDGQPQPETTESEPVEVEGLLDLRDDGYGFLRVKGYLPTSADVYVSVKQVRQFGLRKGDRVTGKSRAASRNEKNPALLQIDAVNGADPATSPDRRRFEDLTPLFPDERLTLETNDAGNMTARIIDLLAPIGKGQRGLIVSPPKAGKTTVVKQVVRSVETNSPDVELIVLLVDERPEEVTDMRRWLIKGEVAASTFDRPSEEHIQVAELVLERAKRQVEAGKDVVIVLDGITRLARAYNLAQPPSGRIMSGGIDAGALYPPKRFFGAARNAEEGGSLTILATALVETGSKMDEHIFEEFKGTGNMELKLDRHLANRRIFPAIDVDASSTRHEELLFERRQVPQVTKLRQVLGALKDSEGASDAAALHLLFDRLKSFKTNTEFLAEVAKAQAPT